MTRRERAFEHVRYEVAALHWRDGDELAARYREVTGTVHDPSWSWSQVADALGKALVQRAYDALLPDDAPGER